MKITVVGAGAVGASCAEYIAIKNFASEVVILDIKEGFKVYFASSNLPAEEIDGMYDGRLRWVKEYPGHNSSMPLYISGTDKTIRVNRSLQIR